MPGSAASEAPVRTKIGYSAQVDPFSSFVMKSIACRKADELPISAFLAGGESPIGQMAFEKRGLAEEGSSSSSSRPCLAEKRGQRR